MAGTTHSLHARRAATREVRVHRERPLTSSVPDSRSRPVPVVQTAPACASAMTAFSGTADVARRPPGMEEISKAAVQRDLVPAGVERQPNDRSSKTRPGAADPLQSVPISWSTDRSTFKADIARRPPAAPQYQKLPFSRRQMAAERVLVKGSNWRCRP